MINIPRIIEFVYNAYGENVLLANLTLKEFGIDPEKHASQQSIHPTSETLHGKLASLTPEQLSALEVLLTPLTCG